MKKLGEMKCFIKGSICLAAVFSRENHARATFGRRAFHVCVKKTLSKLEEKQLF